MRKRLEIWNTAQKWMTMHENVKRKFSLELEPPKRRVPISTGVRNSEIYMNKDHLSSCVYVFNFMALGAKRGPPGYHVFLLTRFIDTSAHSLDRVNQRGEALSLVFIIHCLMYRNCAQLEWEGV
ncbi:hypothetical protein TNCV_4979151 [Trichonephila clavipes]|nr:hypothetical protein TNCV_4979151 [Trichonephila clavipes]